MNVPRADVEALACAITEISDDADSYTVEEALSEKFDVSFEQFHNLIEALVPFTIPAKAALTEEIYHGFVRDGAFIVKATIEAE